MAVQPSRGRPGWLGPLLTAVQFAAIITILFYAAPFDTTKSLTAGIIVFLVALIVALFCSWPA